MVSGLCLPPPTLSDSSPSVPSSNSVTGSRPTRGLDIQAGLACIKQY